MTVSYASAIHTMSFVGKDYMNNTLSVSFCMMLVRHTFWDGREGGIHLNYIVSSNLSCVFFSDCFYLWVTLMDGHKYLFHHALH